MKAVSGVISPFTCVGYWRVRKEALFQATEGHVG